MFFVECYYFSEYDIQMFLFVFWLKGAHPQCVKMRTVAGITPHVYVRTYTISFHVLLLWCLALVVEISLTFIQKECVCQKWLFFSNEINFCCNEISNVFTLNWFSKPNLAETPLILIK